jgi:hypothetical protein
MPRIREIQAQSEAQAQAEVDAVMASAPGVKTKPVATTANGSTNSNSTTAADFTIKNGVAKPNSLPSLRAVKEFQVELNRVGRVKGLGTIGIDGEIGPATIALTNKVSSACGGTGTNSIPDLITHLPSSTTSVRECANKFGAPPPSAKDMGDLARAGTILVTSTTGKQVLFKPPGAGGAGLIDIVKNMSGTAKIAVGGVVLIGGILAFKKLRRGRATSPAAAAAPATNPRRRRRRRR